MLPQTFNIVFLGAGNLATHFALALSDAGHQIVQIYSKTTKSAEELASKLSTKFTTNLLEIKQDADILIYAVSDDALDSLISANIAPNAIHVHTAGSVSIDIFKGKTTNFGVFYPLQTFSKNKSLNFRVIPVFLEASDDFVAGKLQMLAESVSDKIKFLNSVDRKKMHIAAVFASNFVNYLYHVAEDIVKEAGIDFDTLKPLILETADKIRYLSPELAQTGPAKRNDAGVLMSHQQMLSEKPELQQLYHHLSQLISDKHLHQP